MSDKETASEAKRRRLEEKMGGGSEAGLGGFGASSQTVAAARKPKKVDVGPKREDFVMNANEAVSFRLVHQENDMESAQLFNPEYTNQIFREDETIFGFKELEINVYMHAVSFHTFIAISHKGIAPMQLGAPDNIEARLHETFPGGYTMDRSEFLKWLQELGPSPSAPGTMKSELYADSKGVKVFQLDVQHTAARALHLRLAPFVLFEIDGGQLLNLEEEPLWEVLLCTCPSERGGQAVAGFATVYRFQIFPDVVRFRLSQLIVLFPYRRRGYATAMIEAVRTLAIREGAIDYTVEDPTDAFQRRREIADVAAARQVPEVVEAVTAAVKAADTLAEESARIAALALPANVATVLRDKLKLGKAQQRKVWPALLFAAAREAKMDPGSPAATAFRDWTLRRLQRASGSDSAKQAAAKKLLVDKELERQEAMEFLSAPGFLMCRAKNVTQPAAIREEEEPEEAVAEALATSLSEEFDRLLAIATAVTGPRSSAAV